MSGVYGPLCGIGIKSGSKLQHTISKKLTHYLDCRTDLATTVNIMDRQGVIQRMMMMMMTFRDVAQSAVNNKYKAEARDNLRLNMVIPQG